MKRVICGIVTTVLIVVLLLPGVEAFAAGDIIYSNTQALSDNLDFTNTISYNSTDGRRESFDLSLTGAGDAYPMIMTGETVFGATTISSVIAYAESQGKNVLAAMNTDFFFSQTGIPIGMVIEEGRYISSPGGRSTVAIGYDGSVSIFENAGVQISLYNNGQIDDWRSIVLNDISNGADETLFDGDFSGEGFEHDGYDGYNGYDGGYDDFESFENNNVNNETIDSGSENGEGFGNAGETVTLSNLNKTRTDTGGMVLYTEDFSTVSTRTTTPGWFVRFRVLDGTLTVSGKMMLEVVETLESERAVPIGEGYMVLTAAHTAYRDGQFRKFEIGDIVTLSTKPNTQRLLDVRSATGSGDILVSNGVKTNPERWNNSLKPRAPRTAFGVREDGSMISIVVDGRNTVHSVGMTLNELADRMIAMGAVYAVNLDGGGSSAMRVRIPGDSNATLINRPSDGSERRCSTYLLFVTDKISDGRTKNLSIRNDGVIVLAGSSINLDFAATDSGYKPVAVPQDIVATPSAYDAVLTERRFTAGSEAGTDILSLYSPSTGAVGSGNIVVITRPTSITPAIKGTDTPLTAVRLAPGEVLEFDVIASYYRRPVIAELHSFTYEVTGEIGEMIEPGLFEAGNIMQAKGSIIVSAGGRETVIDVEIGGFVDMENHWAREYAEFLYTTGITVGITATEYGPNLIMKRGDYILMLHRAAGEPMPLSQENYDDVPSDMYYYDAIAWAKELGIADSPEGEDPGIFDPQGELTRQDAFVFSYRALNAIGVEADDGTEEDIEGFPDADQLTERSLIPTATLIKLGIVEGMGGYLAPNDTMTRAQMAKVVTMLVSI